MALRLWLQLWISTLYYCSYIINDFKNSKNQCKNFTYQFRTQCKGVICHPFKTAKIIVWPREVQKSKCALTRRAANMNQPIENRPNFDICNSNSAHTVSHVAYYKIEHVLCIECESKKAAPPKTLCNIFTHVKNIFVKFCQYVASLYLHIFTNFGRFILIFNKMALIYLGVPIVFLRFHFRFHQVKSP